MSKLPKILVIVGPTASGKTALGVALAKALGGEVISADSRLLYRGMDIGTAKPTKKEMAGVPHHLIGIVRPDRNLVLAQYQALALRAIRGVLKRGRLPIIVGGTGLYVRALVDNLEIPAVPPDPLLRSRLEAMPPSELAAWLRALDPAAARLVAANPRRAIRALEVIRATGRPFSELQGRGEPLFDALQIGLVPPRDVLEKRIARRTEAMAAAGLVAEVRRLRRRYSEAAPALSGIGYRELFPYLRGEITLAEALEAVRLHTRQYAKRQLTWFKRDGRITWLATPKKALVLAKKWLKTG